MLETTRKRGATVLIYLVFGTLIAVFVINFGPASVGSDQGCTGSGQSQTVVTIADRDYNWNSWRWVYNSQGAGAIEERTTGALDALLIREMLAQEAERRGLAVEESMVDARIKAGEVYVRGLKYDGTQPETRFSYFDDGEFFNYKSLMNVVYSFGLKSIAQYKAEQRRELMARAMRKVLESGAQVSADEAMAAWMQESLEVEVDVVRFDVADYADKMILADADVDRFLAAHGAEVQAAYDADKTKYTATSPRVRLRRVFVEKPEDAASGAATGADAGVAEAKPTDPGKAKLEAARAEIVSKKKTFAQVAAALDSDDVIRGKQGDLGWKLVDAPNLGEPGLDEAVKALAPGGEPSPVIETPEGWYLLYADEKREGDLTFDQVKREIASEMAAKEWAREAAKRAALAAHADAKAAIAGGKKLSDLYEKSQPALPPELKQQLLDQQMQQLKEELKNPLPEEIRERLEWQLKRLEKGELTMAPRVYEQDVPAAWQDADAAAGGAAPAAGGAAPAADPLAPSKDQLPAFGKLDKAQVERLGPLPRDGDRMGELGRSQELSDALFLTLAEGALADRVYEVKTEGGSLGGDASFVVVQLVRRSEPNLAEFEKEAEEYRRQLESTRADGIVRSWLSARCSELVSGKSIKISNEILRTTDEEGKEATIPYAACSSL